MQDEFLPSSEHAPQPESSELLGAPISQELESESESADSGVVTIAIEPVDNQRLINLCGPLDSHIRQLERRLEVDIHAYQHGFYVMGPTESAQVAGEILRKLYDITCNETVTPDKIHLFLQQASREDMLEENHTETIIRIRRGIIKGRGPNQCNYLDRMKTFDLNFGIGPAGTGKTYLAVASAVAAFENEQVRRIVLVRPAVEAGERLGFLPGDLAQKIDPYLRPLYDGLYEMMGFDRVTKLIERSAIEVAPLAYMRGRTLNESFIIMDEAQNTTPEQMKMFLTRIGFASTAVVNGDITQIDLPRGQKSGLRQAIRILKDVEGIGFTFFDSKDVVRHLLVARILDAYHSYEAEDEKKENAKSKE